MPTPTRKIRDGHDADSCLDAVATSGMTLTSWAHAHGVDARSLNMWRVIRSRRRSTAQPSLRLVELLPVHPPAPPFRVQVADVVVDVPGDFDADALSRLIGVLRRC